MISNYYLDINKVSLLPNEDKIRIHEYYREMIFSFQDNRNMVGESIFNTLARSGYLIDIRNEKIEEILNENNCIRS